MPLTSFYSLPEKHSHSIIKPLFFGPHAFHNRFDIGSGEYEVGFIDRTTGQWYDAKGIPSAFGISHMWKTRAGAHHYIAIDSSGNFYAGGDGSDGELGNGGATVPEGSFVAVTTDSLNNAFGNIIDLGTGGTNGGWVTWVLKSDGTVWATGQLTDGVRGNGTVGGKTTKFVQIPFPGGVIIKQVIISEVCIALSTTGDVYTWGAQTLGGGSWAPFVLAQGVSSGYVTNTPTKITLPAPATMIAGGNENGNYALLNNGKLYGWGYHIEYFGVNRGIDNFGYNPINITDSLGLTAGTIDTIGTNSMSTIAILTDSTIRFWGDNATGDAGIGPGLDMRHLQYGGVPSPWGWSQGSAEAIVNNRKPINPTPGKHNWTQIFGSISFCFQWYLEDAGDTVYSMGRNKYQVTDYHQQEIEPANGVLGGTYADNWDRNYIGPVFFFRYSTYVNTTGRICKDSAGQWCSTWPWDGSKAGPTANAGSNQTISTSYTTLKGSTTVASGVSGKIYPLWTCIGKPTGAADPLIPIRAWDTVAVSGLTSVGVYTFKYWTEDSNFKVDSATVTVQVGCNSCIVHPRRGRRKYFNL